MAEWAFARMGFRLYGDNRINRAAIPSLIGKLSMIVCDENTLLISKWTEWNSYEIPQFFFLKNS